MLDVQSSYKLFTKAYYGLLLGLNALTIILGVIYLLYGGNPSFKIHLEFYY